MKLIKDSFNRLKQSGQTITAKQQKLVLLLLLLMLLSVLKEEEIIVSKILFEIMFPKKPSTTEQHTFDEARWVINVRKSLDTELEEDDLENVTVSIFTVPKALMCSNPDSYTPHRVSIGPYHSLKPELHEMERYKLMIARRFRNQSKSFVFHDLVEKFQSMEIKIRACYHNYIGLNGETLLWIMVLDSSFLIEFLKIYSFKKVDRFGHNEILRDIMMIENQIPLFVLRKTLEFQLDSIEEADDVLISVLKGLCKDLSPLVIKDGEILKSQLHEFNHILDFLYQMIVPRLEEEEEEEDENRVDENRASRFLQEIKLLTSRFTDFILRIISNLPGFIALNYLFTRQEHEATTRTQEPDIEKPPLVEELTIPSVSDLYKSGVRFKPTTNGNISTVKFDSNTGQFHLPVINLDINTETILRNLVAYEASNTSGPLVFTRYTELINGIIDSEEDVRLLREQGVLVSRLKSDEEAAEMWNGMSKSVRLTRVGFLDKTIEDVNRYYTGRWKVKIGRFVEVYVYGSWQILAFFAAVLVLMLVSLQVLSLVFSSLRLLRLRTG